jgi:hypothetical protein
MAVIEVGEPILDGSNVIIPIDRTKYMDGSPINDGYYRADVPVPADVKTGVSYTDSYRTELTGEYVDQCDYPAVSFVRDGILFASGALMGTYKTPDEILDITGQGYGDGWGTDYGNPLRGVIVLSRYAEMDPQVEHGPIPIRSDATVDSRVSNRRLAVRVSISDFTRIGTTITVNLEKSGDR